VEAATEKVEAEPTATGWADDESELSLQSKEEEG
jgi:hypothetical protein